jgi:putative transposase
VPTVRCQVLFCFLVLAHDRRRVLHVNVTDHPTAAWTAQQILEAFPWDTAPRYLLRDRDTIYGAAFRQRVAGLGLAEVLTAPHAPWQSPCVERLIGSIRRQCLDHVIVVNARHPRRLLARYLRDDHRTWTHLSLEKDAPEPRPADPPGHGPIVEVPEVGGLHHRYEWRAA